MKKKMILIAALVSAMSASAQWKAPVYDGPFVPMTVGENVYIYNKNANLFLTEGNDWGTHASVGLDGLKFIVQQYVAGEEEWDGVSYTIGCYSNKKQGDFNMFFEQGGHVYVDGNTTSKTDFLFSFVDKGDNTYQITGSSANPTYNASGEMEGYVVGRFTGYVDDKDGITTGTGVIYDYFGTDNNYQEGEFQTLWSFVSESDYAVYVTKVETYNAASQLGEKISEAEKLGVPDLDAEKSVYNNTNSTVSEIEEAMSSLEKKVLAHYEVTITPDSPVIIATDECNSVDGWNNAIGATTWNTQNWVPDEWTGLEGNTLNIWGASMNGTVDKTVTDLPKGIYVVSVGVFSEKLESYAFANDNKKVIPAGAAGKTYEVTTEVTDGTLKYGVGMENAGENWIALDNAVVKYYGAGVEAYRYWLNGLLESAPSFDNVTVQKSLVSEYEGVLASVNTVSTKEEILGIIPSYEDVLNRINLNIEAYSALKTAIDDADDYINGSNEYYGEKLGDYVSETATPTYETCEASTEETAKITETLKGIEAEAQEYMWKKETLDTQILKLQELYNEYSDVCKPEAEKTAKDLLTSLENKDYSKCTYEDIVALLNDIYDAEFNLEVPADEATDENPVDYTAKINYPSYDSNAEGWTNDGWSTCANNTGWYGFATVDGALGDQNYLNLWTANAVCSVSQTLTGLPNGTYVVKVGAYADAQGFQVFANADYLDVEVGQTEAGERGQWYEIVTTVTDGTLTLGARNTVAAENWCMIDNWSLSYCGTKSQKTPTEISSANMTSALSAVYTITGVRANSLNKGLNIVKMADGSARKVIVK